MLLSVPPHPQKLQKIDVVYQDEAPQHSQQIVTDVTPPTKDLVKDLKNKVDRLSAVTQRVLKEQVARRSGRKTVNGGPSTPPSKSTANSMARNSHPNSLNAKTFDDTSSDRPSITAPMGGNVSPHQQLEDSSISDYIPEIKQGGFTALNTDQFVYYTFYSRINEQIRNRWVTNIQNILYRTPQSVLNQWSAVPQVTQVEILLDPSGHFVRATLYRHAQSKDLDQAAVSAFRLASPFNNPPSELVKSDGYIHLYYVFHLEFRPRFLASDGSS